ncbi:MAG TPA: c-type cytochrome [Polyangiaceae bacterium]|jgi:mono/diheme cytochrome c family protein|nr:c-type cytochrome [Polyangiaceae bacterium]
MWKKIVGGVAAVLVLAILGLVVKFYLLSPRSRPAPDVKAPTTAEAIARGKYLVDSVTACLGCHSQVDDTISGEPPVPGRLGSGRDFGLLPGFPGHIRAPNLTPDKDTGIGSWSDGEVARAIREGVTKDGRPLFPMMPYGSYGKSLSDADTLAIVAYLRTLPAIKNDVGRTQIDFPVSMFVRAAPAPLEKSPSGEPPESDVVARGEWLLTVCSCHDCHDSVNARHEPIAGKSLAGGGEMPIPGKGSVYSANITSDPATGIGAYSDDDLLRVFNEGKGKSGATLYVMPWRYYGGMTDADKRALIAALRKVPAVQNVVPAATFAR